MRWLPTDNKLTITDKISATQTTTRVFDPEGDKVYQTLWDGAGTEDVYDLSAFTSNLTVDLRPGEWVKFNNGQVVRSLIENAIGGDGGDTFVANKVANEFMGDGTIDTLADADRFEWKDIASLQNPGTAEWDRILDFEAGVDKIDVSGLGMSKGDSKFANGHLELYSTTELLTKIQVDIVNGVAFAANDWIA